MDSVQLESWTQDSSPARHGQREFGDKMLCQQEQVPWGSFEDRRRIPACLQLSPWE